MLIQKNNFAPYSSGIWGILLFGVYSVMVISIVLRIVPLSLRETVISASPLAIAERAKLPLNEPLLRTFSQSAVSVFPSLSVSVRVIVIGAEMVSVPAVQEIRRVSVFLNTVV